MRLLVEGLRRFWVRRAGRGAGFAVGEGPPGGGRRTGAFVEYVGVRLVELGWPFPPDVPPPPWDRATAERWARCLDALVAGWPLSSVVVEGRAFLMHDGRAPVADARLVVARANLTGPEVRVATRHILLWESTWPLVEERLVLACPGEDFSDEGPARQRGLALFGAWPVRRAGPTLLDGNVSPR